MKLDHIPLDQLKPSRLNVRRKGGKDHADLLPSIRAMGLLQPLLVRPNCDGFDIVAGQRRYHALVALAAEGDGTPDPVPCAIMEEGDDARAVEASLAENIARLPMDEIDQYKAFAALRGKGLAVEDIASRFGVTQRLVEQRLAIAAIIPPILTAYRREDIRPDTLRMLTMATPRQQRDWWALYKSEDAYAPEGRQLRDWLFGGAQVPVKNALFDLGLYQGGIVADLFGEDSYFADGAAFWALQRDAIAAARQRYLDGGWREVVVLEAGEHFASWSHRKTTKAKGGKVYVSVTRDGEVTFHEGWLDEKEANKRAKAEAAAAGDDGGGDGGVADVTMAERPECTVALRNYIGLHKHAAARTALLQRPDIALRLTVAHMLAGSWLWRVEVEAQRADSEAIAASLAASKAEGLFRTEERAMQDLLAPLGEGPPDLESLFAFLLTLSEADVLRLQAFAMAQALAAHHPVVEGLGQVLGTDLRDWWEADSTFLDLIRDKQVLNAILREVAGAVTADAHLTSTAKVQRKIIADCLTGEGRPKVEGWLPRWLAFPAGSYRSPAAE